jgi:hypothetical protein
VRDKNSIPKFRDKPKVSGQIFLQRFPQYNIAGLYGEAALEDEAVEFGDVEACAYGMDHL